MSRIENEEVERERIFWELQNLQYTKINFYDQQRMMLSYEQRVATAALLYLEILTIFHDASLNVISGTYRAKTDESMLNKASKANPHWRWWPLADLYGTRIIMPESQPPQAVEVLLSHFSGTDVYPYKIPNVEDFTNPSTKRTDYMHPDYKGIHVTVAFGGQQYIPSDEFDKKNPGLVPNLAEIQLFTHDQYQIALRTRGYFEEQQYRDIRIRRKELRKLRKSWI